MGAEGGAADPQHDQGIEAVAGGQSGARDAVKVGPPVREVGERKPALRAALGKRATNLVQLGGERYELLRRDSLASPYGPRQQALQVEPDRHGLAPPTAPMIRHRWAGCNSRSREGQGSGHWGTDPFGLSCAPWPLASWRGTRTSCAPPWHPDAATARASCSPMGASTSCMPATCAIWRRHARSATCWWSA